MDGIFGIGPLELFFVAIIALIVLGPERLPGALREVAKTIRRVREITNEFTNQFGDELKALDEINPRKILSEMVDPTKPLPGEKSSELAEGKSAANKPVATPKPGASPQDASKAKVTANAALSSKAATEAARATKAAKEAEAAKATEAKAVAAAANGVNGAESDIPEVAAGEVENSIMPPKGAAPTADLPITDLPTTGLPTTNSPIADSLTTDALSTDALATDALATDALSTDPTPMDERA